MISLYVSFLFSTNPSSNFLTSVSSLTNCVYDIDKVYLYAIVILHNMVSKRIKRKTSGMENVKDSLKMSYPKFELCSYDYLAYLADPKLNKLSRPSTPFEEVLKRQKKFLADLTITLRYMSMENRPESYLSKFLASEEFNKFQDILMTIYLSPKASKSDEAMAIYTNLIIMGANGIKQLMPKSFHPVLDRDLLPLQKLCHSIAEYSKQLGKKGELVNLDFTKSDGL